MSISHSRNAGAARSRRFDPKFDLMQAARHLSHAALEVLHRAMLSPTSKVSEQVAAASIILDRGWGRAPQSIHMDVTQRPSELCHLTTTELQVIASGQPLPRRVTLVEGELLDAESSA